MKFINIDNELRATKDIKRIYITQKVVDAPNKIELGNSYWCTVELYLMIDFYCPVNNLIIDLPYRKIELEVIAIAGRGFEEDSDKKLIDARNKLLTKISELQEQLNG